MHECLVEWFRTNSHPLSFQQNAILRKQATESRVNYHKNSSYKVKILCPADQIRPWPQASWGASPTVPSEAELLVLVWPDLCTDMHYQTQDGWFDEKKASTSPCAHVLDVLSDINRGNQKISVAFNFFFYYLFFLSENRLLTFHFKHCGIKAPLWLNLNLWTVVVVGMCPHIFGTV